MRTNLQEVDLPLLLERNFGILYSNKSLISYWAETEIDFLVRWFASLTGGGFKKIFSFRLSYR